MLKPTAVYSSILISLKKRVVMVPDCAILLFLKAENTRQIAPFIFKNLLD